MKLLMTASQIRGLPVVTVRGGEDLAEVRDVIYDPEAGRLVGLTLNKRGFLAMLDDPRPSATFSATTC